METDLGFGGSYMAGNAARPMGVRCLEDLDDLVGRSVLVRATLDLPFCGESDSPSAALRTSRLLATLEYLVGKGAEVTVWGDPSHPARAPETEHLRCLRATVERAGSKVQLADWTKSAEDPSTVSDLVGSHDAFVNDSFQWSYLPLPSLLVPPDRLPSACGRSLQRDLEIAERILQRPGRPFVAILGGADPALRLNRLEGLVLRADHVLVGAAMTADLLTATGEGPGCESRTSSEYRSVIGLANRVGHPIEIPTDLLVLRADGSVEAVTTEEGVEGQVVDIGPATARLFSELVEGAGTVLWTGTLGEVEDPRFVSGTLAVARHLTRRREGTTIVGGDALTDLMLQTGELESNIEVASATDSLLELLKNGDLPALPPLRGDVRP